MRPGATTRARWLDRYGLPTRVLARQSGGGTGDRWDYFSTEECSYGMSLTRDQQGFSRGCSGGVGR